jgi:prepilin-type N-terminal cleavage/methylation domain-containing protein
MTTHASARRHNPLSPRLPRPRACGFTLIELLVVIAVIALLIGILVPSLNGARDAARTVKCQTQLRQFVMASNSYSNSYRGFYGTGAWDNDVNEAFGPPDTHGWVADMVNGEYAIPGTMLCPTNPAQYSTTVGEINDGARYKPFSPAEVQNLLARGFNTNYVMTWYYAHTDRKNHSQLSDWKNKDKSRGPLNEKSFAISGASKVPLLADAAHQALDASDVIVLDGITYRTAKTLTDGPTVAVNVPGLGNGCGTQNFTDMGPAHGKSGRFVDEEFDTTRIDGNIGFADGNVQLFKDTGRRDGKWGSTTATLSGMQYNKLDDLDPNKVYSGWLTKQGALNF